MSAKRAQKLGHFVAQALRHLGAGMASARWWPPVALLAAAVYWFSVASEIPLPVKNEVADPGAYGDSFGRLTSLFTALGFGGLIVTLLLQQRQIKMQEDASRIQRQKDEKDRYENVLFRLLEVYRQTLSEVRVGELCGRDVLRDALDRVDAGLLEEGVHNLPKDLISRRDKGKLSSDDRCHIDYFHYRNFKIVSVEIHQQARLLDTFQVLLEHMSRGAPEHLLIDSYRKLVFAQLTFLEARYFFLIALVQPGRAKLRALLKDTGYLDELSRSQLHRLHREMYKEYWGYDMVEKRELPPNNPMAAERIRKGFSAHRAAGGSPRSTYAPIRTRQEQQAEALKTSTDEPSGG